MELSGFDSYNLPLFSMRIPAGIRRIYSPEECGFFFFLRPDDALLVLCP